MTSVCLLICQAYLAGAGMGNFLEAIADERNQHAVVCAVLVSQGHWDQATERAQIVFNLSKALERAATELQVTAP